MYTLLDGVLIKYDVESSTLLWEIGEDVLCFCVSPDEREAVLASKKNVLLHYTYADTYTSYHAWLTRLCRLEDGVCVRTIKGHTMPVTCMAYDPSGATALPILLHFILYFVLHFTLHL